MSDDDPADRVEAVLADAREAIRDATDGGDADATPTLQAVSEAAASLVEEADSAALLAAVDLDDEDYGSVPEAIAEGDPDRVRELEQLLKLSRLADAWDDPEGDRLRADLPDLFGVATEEDDETGDGNDESEAGDGEDSESADESAEAAESEGEGDGSEESDGDGIVVRAVESITDDEAAGDEEETVTSAVERVAEAAGEGDGSEEGSADDGSDEGGVVRSAVERVADETDGSEEEPDEDEAGDEDEGIVESALRSQLENALDRFREGIDLAEADLDALRAAGDDRDEDETGAESGGTVGGPSSATAHSTVPDRERSATRHSTVPDRDRGTNSER